MNFRNTVAISTGAASGMGLLFAENFAALGGNVVLCDVNEQVLTEKVAAINAKDGGRAIGVGVSDSPTGPFEDALGKLLQVVGSDAVERLLIIGVTLIVGSDIVLQQASPV